MSGAGEVRFLELVRSTIETHGLAWATRYYCARMPAFEARFWLRAAYCA